MKRTTHEIAVQHCSNALINGKNAIQTKWLTHAHKRGRQKSINMTHLVFLFILIKMT